MSCRSYCCLFFTDYGRGCKWGLNIQGLTLASLSIKITIWIQSHNNCVQLSSLFPHSQKISNSICDFDEGPSTLTRGPPGPHKITDGIWNILGMRGGGKEAAHKWLTPLTKLSATSRTTIYNKYLGDVYFWNIYFGWGQLVKIIKLHVQCTLNCANGHTCLLEQLSLGQ